MWKKSKLQNIKHPQIKIEGTYLLFMEEFDLNVSKGGVDSSHIADSTATARLHVGEKGGRRTEKREGGGRKKRERG